MRWHEALKTLLIGLLLAFVAAPAPLPADPPFTQWRVVATYPHDSSAFTEGLFWLDGHLYESTGLEGRSTIRKVRLADGRVLRSISLPPLYFGEGIVNWGKEIVSLTWRNGIGFRWDLANFRKRSEWRYPGEGWALTQDGTNLIMSDGTAQLRFLDPHTLREVRRVRVTSEGRPLRNINELEYVRGEILANVWQTSLIARIDPATGAVKGWLDLSALVARARVTDPDAVLNGIAYDGRHDRLFVTGKNWPVLFELKLDTPETAG